MSAGSVISPKSDLNYISQPTVWLNMTIFIIYWSHGIYTVGILSRVFSQRTTTLCHRANNLNLVPKYSVYVMCILVCTDSVKTVIVWFQVNDTEHLPFNGENYR
jgi:hypothetical protein